MSCDRFAERLTAFSLGELSPEEAREARAHLEQCAACTTLALRDRQLVSILRASAVPAPASVHQAVRAAVRGAQPSRRSRWPLSPRLVAAALTSVLLLAALAAFLVVRGTSGEPAEPPELLAAWDIYHEPRLPLRNPQPPPPDAPDLSAAGLRPVRAGELALEGLPATAVEYRGSGTRRMVLFSWHGSLPDRGEGGVPPDLQTSSWGTTTSAWWERHGEVYCAVGDLPDRSFMTAVRTLRRSAG
jgi:anti-sigma factor RsiW